MRGCDFHGVRETDHSVRARAVAIARRHVADVTGDESLAIGASPHTNKDSVFQRRRRAACAAIRDAGLVVPDGQMPNQPLSSNTILSAGNVGVASASTGYGSDLKKAFQRKIKAKLYPQAISDADPGTSREDGLDEKDWRERQNELAAAWVAHLDQLVADGHLPGLGA